MRQKTSLPNLLNEIILKLLKDYKDFSTPEKRAKAIQKLSDFYIENPKAETPWRQEWTQVAYLSYYLPLNFIRAQRVLEHIQNFLQEKEIRIVDYGSGLGSGSLPLFLNQLVTEATFIEKSEVARDLHQNIFKELSLTGTWHRETQGNLTRPNMAIFSYSLTELDDIPEWTKDLEHLLILEPSTQQDGRSLMQLRQDMIDGDWKAIAPCTHQDHCPLLTESKKDWCHDRVIPDLPDWFLQQEKFLSFKNQSLTLSYLFLSKSITPKSYENQARLVGDPLKEKGKTRQLFCRGPEREFLSWLDKKKNYVDLHRGDLVAIPSAAVKVSNELRWP